MKCPQLKMLMKKKISLKNKNSSTSFTPKKEEVRISRNEGVRCIKMQKTINQKSMHANRSIDRSISLLIPTTRLYWSYCSHYKLHTMEMNGSVRVKFILIIIAKTFSYLWLSLFVFKIIYLFLIRVVHMLRELEWKKRRKEEKIQVALYLRHTNLHQC